MQYMDFGQGVSASRIVLGTDSLGGLSLVNKRSNLKLLDKAFDCGINTFETARMYRSEPLLGQWVSSRRRRSKIFLVTKGGFPSQPTTENILRDCHSSLRALRSEYVDSYLLHYDCESADIQDMLHTLDGLRAQGKVLSFGLSNFTLRRVQQAHEYCCLNGVIPARFVSAHYGLMAWNTPYWKNAQTLVGPENRIARAWYESRGYSIFAYSPLGRGYFKFKAETGHRVTPDDSAANEERYHRACELACVKNVSPAQIALAYLLCQSSNVLAVIGCRTVEHLHADAAASGIALSGSECSWLAMDSEPALSKR